MNKYDTFVPATMEKGMEGTDPIVLMMTEWYDKLELDTSYPFGSGPEGFASYERQVIIGKVIFNKGYIFRK